MKSLLLLLILGAGHGFGMDGHCLFAEIGKSVGIEISDREWREKYQLPTHLAPILAAASPEVQMAFLQFKHTGRFTFEEMQNIVGTAHPILVRAFLEQIQVSLAWSEPFVTPEELLQLCANVRAAEDPRLLHSLFRWSAERIIAAGKAAPLDLEKALTAANTLSYSDSHLMWTPVRDLQDFLKEKQSFLENPDGHVFRYLVLDDIYDQTVRLKITSYFHRREMILEDMAGKVLFTAGKEQLQEETSPSGMRVLRLKFPDAGVPTPSADPVVRQFMTDLEAMSFLVNRHNYVPTQGSMVQFRISRTTQEPTTSFPGLTRLRHTP